MCCFTRGWVLKTNYFNKNYAQLPVDQGELDNSRDSMINYH